MEALQEHHCGGLHSFCYPAAGDKREPEQEAFSVEAALFHPHKRTKNCDDDDDRDGLLSPRLTSENPHRAFPTEHNQQQQLVSEPVYPFFYYKDHSTLADPDPLTPLTPAGRVPNFPAKMHSILSRPELADVVSWMPHGRSWRVLKPREFEVRVIPTYFEHAKFSSFIRQANGWGFRRITQGRDRNSYYHELFLRGLPHLCKKMKRPGVNEKLPAEQDHEPDLYRISEIHPVPDKAEDESAILLQCTVRGGPKARMPICAPGTAAAGMALPGTLECAKPHPGAVYAPQQQQPWNLPFQQQQQQAPPPLDFRMPSAGPTALSVSFSVPQPLPQSQQQQPALTPQDQQALSAFSRSLVSSENELVKGNWALPAQPEPIPALPPNTMLPAAQAPVAPFYPPVAVPAFANNGGGTNADGSDRSGDACKGGGNSIEMAALAAANQLAFASAPAANAASAGNPAGLAQFAAGFAAATALSQQQFQGLLGSLASATATAKGSVGIAPVTAPGPNPPPPQQHPHPQPQPQPQQQQQQQQQHPQPQPQQQQQQQQHPQPQQQQEQQQQQQQQQPLLPSSLPSQQPAALPAPPRQHNHYQQQQQQQTPFAAQPGPSLHQPQQHQQLQQQEQMHQHQHQHQQQETAPQQNQHELPQQQASPQQHQLQQLQEQEQLQEFMETWGDQSLPY